VLVLGFLLDELANGMRLEEAGCGLRLDKNSFMAGEIVERACRLVSGDDEAVARTVERLRRIATESTRRKGLAANLIEEAL
jgi:UDP:flavonoid glycosyltransferase YjiC (YdhE family)